jgi:hypothetical protein
MTFYNSLESADPPFADLSADDRFKFNLFAEIAEQVAGEWEEDEFDPAVLELAKEELKKR